MLSGEFLGLPMGILRQTSRSDSGSHATAIRGQSPLQTCFTRSTVYRS